MSVGIAPHFERPPRCGPVEIRTWTEYTSDAHPRRHVAPPRYV